MKIKIDGIFFLSYNPFVFFAFCFTSRYLSVSVTPLFRSSRPNSLICVYHYLLIHVLSSNGIQPTSYGAVSGPLGFKMGRYRQYFLLGPFDVDWTRGLGRFLALLTSDPSAHQHSKPVLVLILFLIFFYSIVFFTHV